MLFRTSHAEIMKVVFSKYSSVAEAAEGLGLSQTVVYRYLSENQKIATLETVKRLRQLFGAKAVEEIEGEDDPFLIIYKVNSAEFRKVFHSQQKSLLKIANEIKVDRALLYKYLIENRRVTLKTAKKLQQYFGEKIVDRIE